MYATDPSLPGSASRAGPVNFSPTAHIKHSWSPSFRGLLQRRGLCRTVPFAGRLLPGPDGDVLLALPVAQGNQFRAGLLLTRCFLPGMVFHPKLPRGQDSAGRSLGLEFDGLAYLGGLLVSFALHNRI